jgi:SPP1 family phage portal protein
MYSRRNIPFFQTGVEELQISDILSIIMEHKQFTSKYRKNERYYDGDHEILKRKSLDSSKPNNKVVLDLPAYTVDVRTGYFSGEPIVFTSENEAQHEAIRDIINSNDFQYLNTELDVMSSIYGHAFMIVYLDEDGDIKLGIDDPYNTLVIHDTTIARNVMGAIRYFEYSDVVTGDDMIKITLYTKHNIYELEGPLDSPEVISEQINIFGDIPVIEFMENSNRCGSFEKQISIVDAMESILSSTINEIEYFDNAYLHLKGVVDNLNELDNFVDENGNKIDPFEDMKNNRTLITLGDGDAKFLTKDINDTYIEHTLERLKNDYHKLCKTPALNEENFGNASGVSLKYKLFNLEKDVARKESQWRKSLQHMLKLITVYHNLKAMNFNAKDIKITFVRALPHNEAEAADIISKLVGIVSRKTLLAQLDFVDDPEYELKQLDIENQDIIRLADIRANAQNIVELSQEGNSEELMNDEEQNDGR